MLHAGLFFEPEDRGDTFLGNAVDFQRTTRHHIPENKTLTLILASALDGGDSSASAPASAPPGKQSPVPSG
jgi:hypothetical protein